MKRFLLSALVLVATAFSVFAYEDLTKTDEKTGKPGLLTFAFDGMDDFKKSFDKIARKYGFPMRYRDTEWLDSFTEGKYRYFAPKFTDDGTKETNVYKGAKSHAFVLTFAKMSATSYLISAMHLEGENLLMTMTTVSERSTSRYNFVHLKDNNVLAELDKTASKRFSEAEALTSAEREAARKKYEAFVAEADKRGKTLYEKQILPLKEKARKNGVSVSVSSCAIRTNSAGGVDVKIEFQNLSNRKFKYITFDATPYNRVDDPVRDDFGNSRTSIKYTGYVNPQEKVTTTTPEPIWYSRSVSYIKLNSVKIIYSDNSTETINDMDKVLNAGNANVKTVVLKDGDGYKLTLDYDFGKDTFCVNLYKDYVNDLMSNSINYRVKFKTQRHLIGDEFVDSFVPKMSYEKYGQKYDLNFGLLASTVSAAFVHEGWGATPGSGKKEVVIYEFSDEDIQRVRDFACVFLYRFGK